MKITEKITINPQNITWFESDINYTKIYLVDGSSIMVAYTLKKIEQQIKSNKNFIRIHRSYIVNRSYINAITTENKDIFVRLTDNLELLVSRRKRNFVKGLPETTFAIKQNYK